MAKKITKEKLKKEILRCGTDPIYFLNTYGKISHPNRGLLPFKTFQYQDDIVKAILEHRFNIILKSRQIGASTIIAGFIAWFIVYHKDKNVLVLSTKQDTAKNVIRAVKNVISNIPPEIMPTKTISNNVQSVELSNRSRVKALTTSADAGRSEAVSLLFVDEAAIIPDFSEIATGLFPVVSAGGRIVVASTPKGIGGHFHTLYAQAQNGENKFNCRFGEYTNPHNQEEKYTDRFPWWVNPDYDEAWFEHETAGLDPRKIAQEYLCFGGETNIVTNTGFKKIKDIVVGDMVLTHKGNFKKVIFTNSKISDNVYGVKTFFNRNYTFVTGEHPILSENNEWVELEKIQTETKICSSPKKIDFNEANKTIDLLKFVKPKFFKLKINETNDKLIYLNDRRHKTIHNRYIDVDYDLGYFIGLYLSEGNINTNSTCFSFSYPKELDGWVKEIIEVTNTKFGINNTNVFNNGKSGSLVVNSAIVKDVVRLFVDGDKAYNKRLSKFAYENSSKDFLLGVLDGVFCGDGCIKKRYDKVINVTSNDLIYDLKYILTILGHGYFSNGKVPKEAGKGIILGRSVNFRQQYILKLLRTKNKEIQNVSELIGNLSTDGVDVFSGGYKNIYNNTKDHFTCIITEKEKINEEMQVFNIQVEDDESFVTEHFVAHNCNFNTSGDTFLLPEILMRLEMEQEDPIERMGFDNNTWIWRLPESNGVYLISSDIASGIGKDFSTFQVLRLDSKVEQVAEYKGKMSPDMLGLMLVETSKMYNNAVIAPENNSGWSGQTILKINEANWPFLYYSPKKKNEIVDMYTAHLTNGPIAGYTVSSQNRIPMLSKMEQYIRQRDIILRSSRLVEEFRTFIYVGQRPEAMRSHHDDLIMALAGGLWVREEGFLSAYRGEQETKIMLENISVSSKSTKEIKDFDDIGVIYMGNSSQSLRHYGQKGNSFQLGNEILDISWLLRK